MRTTPFTVSRSNAMFESTFKNTTFVPCVAKFLNDIQRSWDILEPLVTAGYQRGLMLVMRGGMEGVTTHADVQLKNLEEILGNEYGDAPIVTMLSSDPREGNSWLTQTATALKHVKAGVDFASRLPVGKRRIVTCHLGSLVTEDTFLSQNSDQWRAQFQREIAPYLKEASQYAKDAKVELKLETVPVPEYGDLAADGKIRYHGENVCDLRNPFYMHRDWGFQEMHEVGWGICLDICHTRTLSQAARMQEASWAGIIFAEDQPRLCLATVLDDVKALRLTDIVHFNDGAGEFTHEGGRFKEGVVPGQGDIADLPKILRLLNLWKIPFVIEVDEDGDFKNRPGTKATIEWILKNS